MGKKPVRINTNEELDRRSRKILQRSERASHVRGPAWTKCKKCGGDAYRDDVEPVYHCMMCAQEWEY
jgi:predicted Zn-ribbon and HTH transcriptional regulator